MKQGTLPLVVEADSADIIATVIQLKGDIEKQTGIPLRVVISGGGESHILAKELGEASIGVLLKPPRPYVGPLIHPGHSVLTPGRIKKPLQWDHRR